LNDKYIAATISTENSQDIYMYTSTTESLSGYFLAMASPENEWAPPKSVTEVNRPLVEYVLAHNRCAKLLFLEQLLEAQGVMYYFDPILKAAHILWRNSVVEIREKAKSIFQDYIAAGKIKNNGGKTIKKNETYSDNDSLMRRWYEI